MGHTVLLVDDEPNVISGLQRALRKEKYRLLTAHSAAKALDVMAREPVDVVITDERMPGMTGSEMLVKIRQEYPGVVRIMLTGQPTPEGVARAVNQAAIYRYLQKPCNGLDMLITLRGALQHRELVQHAQALVAAADLQSNVLDQVEQKQPESARGEAQNLKLANWKELPADPEALVDKIEARLEKVERVLGDVSGLRPVRGGQGEAKEAPASEKASAGAADVSAASGARGGASGSTAGAASRGGGDSVGQDAQAAGGAAASGTPASPSASTEAEAEAGTASRSVGTVKVLDDQSRSEGFKNLKPLMTRSEIQEVLDSCEELKGMSPTVAQVLKLTQSERCSIEQLVKVVKQDHGVSLKILKLANSAVYTRGEPVDTVHKAVLRIGLSQIRQTVLNLTVLDRFGGVENECVGMPYFWEHSIATGLTAAEIARALGGKEADIDAAFTMGLLHDVGRVVYLETLGDRYVEVHRTAQELDLPLEQVESRMLLVNHADAMDRLLHAWRFPKDLVNPIALHQLSVGNIRRMAARTLNEVATLSLANRLTHALLLGTSGNLSLYPTEDYATALRLEPSLIETIEDTITEQTHDMKFAMLSSSNTGNWPCLKDEVKQTLSTPFRPLYVSEEPAFDSYRIFCDQIRERDEEEPALPNVAVVHARLGREKARLTAKLLAAESESGVAPLPLIILSPKGEIELEDKVMKQRSCRGVPTPVTVSRFVRVYNELIGSV